MKRLLVTAGPTREMLDPVRFLSNLSTGEMGYTLSSVARDKGYRVTLVSGPTALKPPRGVRFISILSADDLMSVCHKLLSKQDVLVMTAAVCDFKAGNRHAQKIHRTKTKSLKLKQTSDIVASLAKRKEKCTIVGFCLETQNWLAQAKSKLERKRLDGIVANYYSSTHVPFGKRKINTAFIGKGNKTVLLKQHSKRQVSLKLLKWIEKIDQGKDF